MFLRDRVAVLTSLAIVLTLGLAAGSAHAAKGQASIGGNFGVGTYSNGDVNDFIQQVSDTVGISLNKVKDGFEFGGSIRYGVSDKAALEIEGNALNGKSSNDVSGGTIEFKTKAFALPLNLLYQLAENDKYGFHLVVGVGPMLSTKLQVSAKPISGQEITGDSDSKTAVFVQGGFEGDWFASKTVALTARVLGRYAKASNIAFDPTDPSAGTFDINLSGVGFGLGLRAYFGSTK